MAAYPSYAVILDSSQGLESGIDDDFAQAGSQHSRIFHSQQYYRYRLYHALTLAQFNSLLATYTAGKRDTYTLTYHAVSPAVTYSVKFTSPPEITSNIRPDIFLVEVNLRGYKN